MNKRKIIFLISAVIIQLALIWPVYPIFSSTHPFVLGIPFSFFWIILILVAAFLLVLWYYLTDTESKSTEH